MVCKVYTVLHIYSMLILPSIGRPSPQNKVMSVISDLNVQVDNLWYGTIRDGTAW